MCVFPILYTVKFWKYTSFSNYPHWTFISHSNKLYIRHMNTLFDNIQKIVPTTCNRYYYDLLLCCCHLLWIGLSQNVTFINVYILWVKNLIRTRCTEKKRISSELLYIFLWIHRLLRWFTIIVYPTSLIDHREWSSSVLLLPSLCSECLGNDLWHRSIRMILWIYRKISVSFSYLSLTMI